jgi:hypothetical protein
MFLTFSNVDKARERRRLRREGECRLRVTITKRFDATIDKIAKERRWTKTATITAAIIEGVERFQSAPDVLRSRLDARKARQVGGRWRRGELVNAIAAIPAATRAALSALVVYGQFKPAAELALARGIASMQRRLDAWFTVPLSSR